MWLIHSSTNISMGNALYVYRPAAFQNYSLVKYLPQGVLNFIVRDNQIIALTILGKLR